MNAAPIQNGKRRSRTVTARQVQLGDAVVAMLAAALPSETIVRTDIPVEELAGFTERRVYVFVAFYTDVLRVSKRVVIAEAPVAVLFAEMYRDPAKSDVTGPIPTAWVDERRGAASELHAILNTTGVKKASRLLGAFWPETCEPTTPVDLVRLDTQKVFWSLTEVAYREFRREGS